MRASLDTNVIIHFYRAHLQQILFDFFEDGLFIYEQIRDIELENHGQDILNQVDEDIAMGRIEVYTDKRLKELSVFKMFGNHVKENRMLYEAGDLGGSFKDEDTEWMQKLVVNYQIRVWSKFEELSRLV